jgi:ubiquinone/menaquinone biosynthesis C-methylase UbiE
VQVTGIDTSERALASARRLAQEGGFTNVCFYLQDLCCLPASRDNLHGAPFDLIHTAFLAPRILRIDYPALLPALWQLCRPGGLIYWTELAFPLTNSLALEQLMGLTCEALASAGQSWTSSSMLTCAGLCSPQQRGRGAAVSPMGLYHLGLTPLLGTWFQQAGFQRVQQVPTAIDISFESEMYACFTRQVEAFLWHIRPLLLTQEATTPEALEALALQIEAEVRHESFCGLCWLLSVLGQKPAEAHASPLQERSHNHERQLVSL